MKQSLKKGTTYSRKHVANMSLACGSLYMGNSASLIYQPYSTITTPFKCLLLQEAFCVTLVLPPNLNSNPCFGLLYLPLTCTYQAEFYPK